MEKKKLILHIEDEISIINLTCMVLEPRGFEVLGATQGLEGLKIMRQRKPDLVLLDLMMPIMDGWEVYRQMKADEELADIPVIVVTAKSHSIDRALGLYAAKVDDYIAKPYGPAELIAGVERVLNKKREVSSLLVSDERQVTNSNRNRKLEN